MPLEPLHQESFTAGEIDERLAAREDYEKYYQAIDLGLNVISQTTGGLTRRPGTEYIDQLPTDSNYWKNNGEADFKLISFNATEEEKYMTVIGHDGNNTIIKLYRDDIYLSTLDGGDAGIPFPYSANEIRDISTVQKLNLLILLHEDYKPRRINRTGTDSFTVEKITFEEIPQYNFNDSDSPSTTDEVQKITFSNMSDGDSYDLSLEGEITAELKYDSSDSTNQERIQSELRRLPNTSSNGINVTNPSSDEFKIKFESNDGAFDWDKIIASVFTGNGNASVTVVTEGASKKEKAWSSTRGWPKYGSFYQSRLWFGGSKELPETIWGSKTSDFLNFDLGNAESDDAIQATIDSNQVAEINWIFPGRNLLVGTEKKEYYIPEEPITPQNFRLISSTRRGSRNNIKPVEIDGAVYYIQRGGSSIRQFVYSFGEDSYKSKNISLLSSHLITDPKHMSLRFSTKTDISDLIFIVNDDGNAAVLSLLRSEDVLSFTRAETKGNFKNTRAMDFDNYFIVERDIPELSNNKNAWDTKKELPEKLEGSASAQNNGYIHVIGGEDPITTGVHYKYDIENNSWEERASLPENRSNGQAEFLEGKLYFGGGNGKKGFYRLKEKANAWEQLGDMPTGLSGGALVESQDRLFLCTQTEIYEYEKNKDDWTKLTNIPLNRKHYSAVAHGDRIYIIGGNTGGGTTQQMQVYSFVADSWINGVTNPSYPREKANAEHVKISSGNEIWLIGGYDVDNNQFVKPIEKYDINNNSWSTEPDIKSKTRNSVSAIKNMRMHIIGGYDGNDQIKQHLRYGNIEPVYYLEKLNEDFLLDVSEEQDVSGSKTISGYDHLKGETVDVHADGFYRGKKDVNKNGEIILDNPAEDYVQAGYDLVTPTVKLLRPTIRSGESTITHRKKRIVEATLQLKDTKGIEINGSKVPFRNLGDNLLDQRIPVFSGNKTIDGLTGWGENVQTVIKQPDPQPMTLLGVIELVSF